MTIRVRVANSLRQVVVLWERHPDHPGGEIFLAGEGEFEVARTPAVEARLRDGQLVLVEQPAVAAATKVAPPEPAKAIKPEPTEAIEPEPEDEIEPAPVAAKANAPVPASAKTPPRRGGL